MSKLDFHSPERKRLGNGLPTWTSSPSVALPQLGLRPAQERGWNVSVIVGGLDYSRQYVATGLSDIELMRLLAQWRAGPEQALEHWWGQQAPKYSVAQASDKSAEELGL